MKKKIKTIEKKLENIKFKGLSHHEGEAVWNTIYTEIEKRSVLSPWILFTNTRKKMIPLIIAALIVAGGGGTVALANNARPGDALFAVDRAAENVRLALSTKSEAKAKLKADFSQERLKEVREIIAEFRSATSTNATSTTATTTPNKKDRVTLGINTALDFLNDVSSDLKASGNVEAELAVKEVISQLENIVNIEDVKVRLKNNGDFQVRLKAGSVVNATTTSTSTAATSTPTEVKIDTSGNKDRIEIREDGERIRIEIKGDEVRVKTKLNSDDDEDSDEEDNDEKYGKDKENNKGRGKGRD